MDRAADAPKETGTAGEVRVFRAGAEEWVAFACGQGVAGSDGFAGRAIQTLRFARPDQPDRPIIEALTPCLDPFDLFDEELAALLESGVRIDEGESGRVDRTDSGGRRPRGPGTDAEGEPEPLES